MTLRRRPRFPGQVMKYVRLSKRLRAPVQMNFPGYQKAAPSSPSYGRHNSCADSWLSEFCADTLLRSSERSQAICDSARVRAADISHWQLRRVERRPLPPSSLLVCSAEMGQSSRGGSWSSTGDYWQTSVLWAFLLFYF